MILLLVSLGFLWFGAATLCAAGMWRESDRRIPRCACGRVPLADRRNHLDHPAIRHGSDLCSPQREIIR